MANQTPLKVIDLLEAHIKKYAPIGVNVTVDRLSIFGDPYNIRTDHPGNEAARAVHRELYGKEPYNVRTGGSIPICGMFLKFLNAYTVNFGFALDDEGFHAPNEFFRLSSFDRGQKGYCKLLYKLAEQEL
jgi:acetylornithine deacetylase/succinyl-diaminopimelate desuccinylase-like protein